MRWFVNFDDVPPVDRRHSYGIHKVRNPAFWVRACLFCLMFIAFDALRQAEARTEVLARADQLAEARNLDGARQVLEKYLENHAEVGPVWQRLRQIYVALARETLARSLDLPEVPAPNGTPQRGADNGPRNIPAPPPAPVTIRVVEAPPPAPQPLPAPPATAPSAPQSGAVGRGDAPRLAQAPQPAAPPVAAAPREASPPAARPNPDNARQDASVAATALAEVENATRAWARAWSARELSQYLGFYAAGFVGSGARNRAEWVEGRRLALERAQDLSIRIERLTLQPVSATRVEVRFWQVYRSAILAVDTWKTLVWEWDGGRWAIVSEVTGGDRRR